MKYKVIRYRVSDAEHLEIKKRAEDFKSISNFLRSAIKEFSDMNSQKKIEAMKELSLLFKKIDTDISHIGGNLNQAMKRANELNAAGLLTDSYFQFSVIPIIKKSISLNKEFRKSLNLIMKTYVL